MEVLCQLRPSELQPSFFNMHVPFRGDGKRWSKFSLSFPSLLIPLLNSVFLPHPCSSYRSALLRRLVKVLSPCNSSIASSLLYTILQLRIVIKSILNTRKSSACWRFLILQDRSSTTHRSSLSSFVGNL